MMGFRRGGPGHRIWYMLGPVAISRYLARPPFSFGQNYKPKAPRLHEPHWSYSRQTFLNQSVGSLPPDRSSAPARGQSRGSHALSYSEPVW
jgi:hypothetical protein